MTHRLATLSWQLPRPSPRHVSRRTLFTVSICPLASRKSHCTLLPSTHTTFPIPPQSRAVSLASTPSSRPSIPETRSVLLKSPTAQDLEEQELDVDLVPTDHIDIALTDRAAEQLQRISTREANPDIALRISVESGGCHGYQYKLGLASTCTPEDYHLTHPDIRPSNLYIDAVSLPMLNGSTIDYATELIGSSFRVTGNPQAKGGCGCGVSWELKDVTTS